EQRSRRRDISILPYQEKKQGNIIMVEPPTAEGTPRTLTLVNFGNNVEYATNFYALIHLPGFSEESQYRLQVHRSTVTEKDTTRKNQVYAKEIDDEPIYIGTKPQLRQRDNRLFLELPPSDGGSSYLLVKIPNSTFENGIYTITLLKNGQDSPVARSLYRSFWVDMPTSLLNLNVAIEMLRFIEDEKRIAKLKDGSDREKERKFREYWEKRDPTPDTEYNELMAEYYRRIDFAYRKYSTVNVNGFNTDQGKIYIRYGPPNKVERKLPPGEPAVEVWTYPNQEFIFRAISDFGQYELVRKRSL
ncbi:MAG: GWxTD domain-containing protein, partial [Balneolaceae bacterium]|nr:GWxTD domain-containing protein [Balneolaceae bacterium]